MKRPANTADFYIVLICVAAILGCGIYFGIDAARKIERARDCRDAGGTIKATSFGEVCVGEGGGDAPRR